MISARNVTQLFAKDSWIAQINNKISLKLSSWLFFLLW